jgi:aminoglycoside 3-N-acetyltransferase
MAALGGRAVWLTRDHPLDYGYGPGSPLAKLCGAGGKVLLIGSDLDEVTLLHYAEHLAPIADKRVLTHYAPIADDDGGRWVTWREFDTTSRGIVDWPDRFFASIVENFLEGGEAATGRLGQSRAALFDAQNLIDHAVPMMAETAAAIQRN